ELIRWLRWAGSAVTVSAFNWGLVVLVPERSDDTVVYSMLMLFLGGLVAGATQSVVATPWLLGATCAGILSPLLVFLLGSGVPGHLYLALTVLVYTINVAHFARRNYRLLQESIELRFGNLDLVRRLTIEKGAAEEAREVAEQATRATNQFLAAASHDIRQPIHAAFLFLGALEQGTQDTGAALDGLRSALVASRQMLDALLDISRLDAGVVEGVLEAFPARALLDRISSVFGPIAARKGLFLGLRAPHDLWLASDRGLCERVVANLTDNALKYTSHGGALVVMRRRSQHCLVQVWDTGIGIAEVDQATIFQEFLQLGNPERDATRVIGLGLSIVKRLCQLLGTRVSVRSTLGKGSVFSFTLPIGSARPVSAHPPACDPAGRGSRVLVVDDSALGREGLRTLLRDWGYEVQTAASIEEMERVLRAGFGVDLALLDYRLPGGATARDAIAVLHAHSRQSIPAIIVTGDTHPERIREAMGAGYTVLFKPVPAAVLKRALSESLAAVTDARPSRAP
ncbi:MAG TPA: hybrid sensor histidine kinase/response regulator, partial [Polyangiaceae bacterium]|nr:hybrid sensor histidine kinase/response regulator [Polyangiaceae bacterium]